MEEVDECHIKVWGASSSMEDLDQQIYEYIKMYEDLEPSFPK